jgi:hypothetical protein
MQARHHRSRYGSTELSMVQLKGNQEKADAVYKINMVEADV